MAKVSVYAKMTAQAGKGDELVAAFEDELKAVADEAGTLVYAMNRVADNRDIIWFFELYADRDALTAHGGSETMRATFPKLAGLLDGRPEIVVSELVGGKGLE